jgi:MFS family permease
MRRGKVGVEMNTPVRRTELLRGAFDGASSYLQKLRLFGINARYYLLFTVLAGLVYGIYWLLFNFYVLSLGYGQELLGQLITVSSLMALGGALPAGVLSDRIGRKPSLLVASLLIAGALAGQVLWPSVVGLFLMCGLLGLGESLATITSGPFLMENSSEEERTYLFSFSVGLNTLAGFAGNWFGGRLPAWVGHTAGFAATSTVAYRGALLAMVGIGLACLVPVLFMKERRRPLSEPGARSSPLRFAREHPRLLGKLTSPMLVTSLGAGLLMPFMNVYFRVAYVQSDAAIGTLFAWGSLAMALGLLVAPPLADRWGKIKLVVLTQAWSIPFLVLLGFSPSYGPAAFAYLIRLGLMNMSTPVYQTFVMEQVEQEARATVASLVSMSWSFGWAFSPSLSGWLQAHHGFDPVFLGTICSYVLAIFMYWQFFGRGRKPVVLDG